MDSDGEEDILHFRESWKIISRIEWTRRNVIVLFVVSVARPWQVQTSFAVPILPEIIRLI